MEGGVINGIPDSLSRQMSKDQRTMEAKLTPKNNSQKGPNEPKPGITLPKQKGTSHEWKTHNPDWVYTVTREVHSVDVYWYLNARGRPQIAPTIENMAGRNLRKLFQHSLTAGTDG